MEKEAIYVMLRLNWCGKNLVPIVRKWPDSTAHCEQVFQGGVDGVGLWPKGKPTLLKFNLELQMFYFS